MGSAESCCSRLNDGSMLDIQNTNKRRKTRDSSDSLSISKQKTNEIAIGKISIEGKSDITTPPLPNQHVFQASDSMTFLLDFQPLIAEQAQVLALFSISLKHRFCSFVQPMKRLFNYLQKYIPYPL